MTFRLANRADLPNLIEMYKEIIQDMNMNRIQIWDEVYPCEYFEEDIVNKRLYVLENDKDIVSAFALLESNPGERRVRWKKDSEKALYIDRFGVNVDYARQGFGSIMLKNAMELALKNNARYLRLFVVDINEPAINLYIKNGFCKAEGNFDETLDNNLTLHEYGFEIQIEG